MDKVLDTNRYDNKIRPDGTAGEGRYKKKKSVLFENIFAFYVIHNFSIDATVVFVNMFVRSIARIDDVKMVR